MFKKFFSSKKIKTQAIAAAACFMLAMSATACSKKDTAAETTPAVTEAAPEVTESAPEVTESAPEVTEGASETTEGSDFVASEDDAIVEDYIVQLTGDEAEDMYQKGMEKYEKGYYPSAVDCFKQVYAYKDSMKLLKESYYQSGLKNYEKESYDRALNYFNKIPKYLDSAQYLNECYYVLGVACFEEGKTSEAKDLLILADPSYKDVADYLSQIGE